MAKGQRTNRVQRRADVRPPYVFVSHDSRDADLAGAFSRLLTNVSHGLLKTFLSSERSTNQGIEYGAEWYPRIVSELSVATDVVCLLTRRSLRRPWILFEAGYAKARNAKVHGIAIGIPLAEVNGTGPFGNFQNCNDSEESLIGLVTQLLSRIPDSTPHAETVCSHVREFLAVNRAYAQAYAEEESARVGDHRGNGEVEGAKVTALSEIVAKLVKDLMAIADERARENFRSGESHSQPEALPVVSNSKGDA